VEHLIAGIAGDITPVCGVSDDEKFQLESAALAELKSTLGNCMAADEMETLWLEYEKGETDEAKLVKDFDKVCFFEKGRLKKKNRPPFLIAVAAIYDK
jgi:putative hydrolase of HD superfamily